MLEDHSVSRPQYVEAAVLAAHTDDLGRVPFDRDGVELGSIPDRLVLVSTLLGVVRAHGVCPDIAAVELGHPFLAPVCTSIATIAHDSGVSVLGLSAVGRRGAVFTSVPKKIVPVFASNDGVLQIELVAGPK